jgi:hypothetical protein
LDKEVQVAAKSNRKASTERRKATPATENGDPTNPTDPEGGERLNRDALLESCGNLATCGDILGEVEGAIRAGGFAGPTTNVLVLYLVVTSRLLARPACSAVRGLSSAGKNFTIGQALKFHPPEAFVEMTALSEKALVYFDEDLRHRVLVIYEGRGAKGDFAAYAIRSLISEGRLKYLFTDWDRGRKARWLTLEGPTGLVTSTAGTIDAELGTRVLTPNISDDSELTREIVRAQARIAAGMEVDVDYGRFHDLQRLIALEVPRVVIPFANQLAEGIDTRPVRVRRDFPAVLTLVEAHALLHRETRMQDESGRLLACVEDYATVHRLVSTMIAEAAEKTVAAGVRETVTVLRELYYTRGPGSEPVSIGEIATKLGIHRATVNRRVNHAIQLGYLVDLSSGRRGTAKELVPGDSMPEDGGILPSPETLR